MPNWPPHIAIVSLTAAIMHYTSLGIELLRAVLEHSWFVIVEPIGSFTLAASLWLFVVLVLPWTALLIRFAMDQYLRLHGWIGSKVSECGAWLRRQAIACLERVLTYLRQPDPLSQQPPQAGTTMSTGV